VRGNGGAGAFGELGHPGPPREAVRVAGVDGSQNQIDNQPFQLLSVADVAVERHGADAKFGRDGTHGQPGGAVAVDDSQRRGRLSQNGAHEGNQPPGGCDDCPMGGTRGVR